MYLLITLNLDPLLGIITHRDFRHKSDDLLVKNVMTPREKLIVIEYNN